MQNRVKSSQIRRAEASFVWLARVAVQKFLRDLLQFGNLTYAKSDSPPPDRWGVPMILRATYTGRADFADANRAMTIRGFLLK
jgi:hypothetical protein